MNPLTHNGYYIYLYVHVTPDITFKAQFSPHRTAPHRVPVYRYVFVSLSEDRAIPDVNSIACINRSVMHSTNFAGGDKLTLKHHF